MTIEICDSPLDIALASWSAPPNVDTERHLSALARGALSFQQCRDCKHRRYPIAPVCPNCGSDAFNWSEISPKGSVYSWTHYPRAPLPAYQPIAPYSVVCVELVDRLRLYGLWLDEAQPTIGASAIAVAERWQDGGMSIAFRGDAS